VQNALVADLAQPRLLGRYLALNGFAFALGGAGGRALGGYALAAAPHGVWLVAAVLSLGIGLSALLLERFIPPAFRRTPRRVSPAAAG
jgi:hypothetical protein